MWFLPALAAGVLFWIGHFARAVKEWRKEGVPFFSRENVLFNRSIIGLSVMTAIVGAAIYGLGLMNPATLFLIILITAMHYFC